MHASLGGLTLSTVNQAIKGRFLQPCSSISVKSLNKLLEPDCTMQGHMDHVRKTNCQQQQHKEVSVWDLALETHFSNESNDFFHKVIDAIDTICTEQTEKFACISKRGNNYSLVTCACNVNAMLVRRLKIEKVKN